MIGEAMRMYREREAQQIQAGKEPTFEVAVLAALERIATALEEIRDSIDRRPA